MYWFKHAQERAAGVEGRRRRNPNAAAYCAREIRDDVAKEVVCDDELKSRGIGDDEDCRRVDVEIADLDIGIASLDISNDARPEASGTQKHIGLWARVESLAASKGPLDRDEDDTMKLVNTRRCLCMRLN